MSFLYLAEGNETNEEIEFSALPNEQSELSALTAIIRKTATDWAGSLSDRTVLLKLITCILINSDQTRCWRVLTFFCFLIFGLNLNAWWINRPERRGIREISIWRYRIWSLLIKLYKKIKSNFWFSFFFESRLVLAILTH